jgi:hypothetical protein
LIVPQGVDAPLGFKFYHTTSIVTKQQVLTEFRDLWADMVKHDRHLRGDHAAKRTAFNNFVDLLNKQRQVTDYQAHNWSNPF